MTRSDDAFAGRTILGNAVLILGIIEGATLVGWRLIQLPKSPALEFLLVSWLRAPRLFAAESLVGIVQLGLTTLSSLPIILALCARSLLNMTDIAPLLVMPFTWGIITGLTLTQWA